MVIVSCRRHHSGRPAARTVARHVHRGPLALPRSHTPLAARLSKR